MKWPSKILNSALRIPNSAFLMSVITLTSDFGNSDSYVAQMKGVILAINPAVRIVDVTHSIPPQDVPRAAAVLEDIVPAFPAGTIHVVVVDPGVGSQRRLLAAEAAGQKILAPDNGTLSLLFCRWPPTAIRELTCDRFWRQPVSATFHGRDVLAPTAAHWSLGADLAEFGPAVARDFLVPLQISRPHRHAGVLVGRVEFADSFGNLITNIAETDLAGADVQVSVAGRKICGLARCYAEQPAGTLLTLIGSSGRLEIAVNRGSAAHELAIGGGAEIRVESGAPGA